MNWKPIVLAAGLALGLSACSTVHLASDLKQEIAEADTDEKRLVLGRIVREDLTEALRSAQIHDDVIAAACWQGILDALGSFDTEEGGGFFTEPKGAFSTFQKARNVRRVLTDGVRPEVKVACAALKEDTRSSVFDVVKRFIPGA